MVSGRPETWSCAQVAAFLTEDLELPPKLADTFKDNAISGADLATLTDDDLTQELQCSSLQARKIRKALTQLGVAAPASLSAGATAVPAPATPAVEPAAPAAAPRPAAPPTAPAGEPNPATAFDPADLERYRQLQGQIAGLHGLQIPARLAQARKHASSLQSQLEGAQRALPGARQAVAEAQREYTSHEEDKWYPGKILGGKSKQQEKLEASKHALDQATRALQQVEHTCATAGAQLQEARSQLAAWQGKESELTSAQRLAEEVVQRMFASPAWRSSPRQNALIDEARVLEGQAVEAHRGVSTYGRGTKLLNSAAARLESAIQSLRGTQVMNMMGMGRGMRRAAVTGVPGGLQPGRLMGDMVELAIFRRANEAVQQAAQETAEARSLLGAGLPQVDESILKAAKAGMFVNLLMGGAMMDIMQAAATRKSISEVETLLSQVKPAAQWAQSNLAAYTQRENGLRAQAEGKRGELERFRSEVLAARLASPGDTARLAAQVGGMSLLDM